MNISEMKTTFNLKPDEQCEKKMTRAEDYWNSARDV
jgi:hypothetical protein